MRVGFDVLLLSTEYQTEPLGKITWQGIMFEIQPRDAITTQNFIFVADFQTELFRL